jgi:hypothetical protein
MVEYVYPFLAAGKSVVFHMNIGTCIISIGNKVPNE